MSDRSDGKVAVITAGGSGIGAAAARRLREDGFDVAILSSSGKGETLAGELGGFGVTGSNRSEEDVRLVTPIMQAQQSGSIVNISTYATFEPDPAFPTSGVFRAGLAAFTKLVADRYAGDGMRMNNVLPGFIDSLPESEERRRQIPMRRYGRTAEIAATIAFLVSTAPAM